MNELALFAGGGGGNLAGHLLGWRTVCAVEIEDYPRRVLLQRQADGLLPRFPIWDDVCTFDGRPWQGKVQVISGGFPCTDISAAGKGAGIDGQDSGLWAEMARIVCEVQPRYVFVENSPMLTSRGLGRVLGDLASMGFDAKWGVLGASEVGAKHKRDRIWIVGNSNNQPGLQASTQTNTQRGQWDAWKDIGWEYWRRTPAPDWQISETVSDRVLDGVANRVDRLKAIGNGQVPLCAATAWRILK
jgi:DNA (cytosine-5)-methyltransferase 1